MATATMGLRRRVPVNGSPLPSSQSSPSVSGGGAAAAASSKRSRSENNNSPSQGNLNSTSASRDEPPTKKSRGTSTSGTKSTSSSSTTTTSTSSSSSSSSSTSSTSSTTSSTNGATPASPSGVLPSEVGGQSCNKSRGSMTSRSKSSSTNDPLLVAGESNGVVAWPVNPTDASAVPYGSVTSLGMPVNTQPAGLCMTTPIPYMSTSMATFVGTATNLGKNSSVSYLDISNMTGGSALSSATSATSSAANALGASGYTCANGPGKTGNPGLDSSSVTFAGIGNANGATNAVVARPAPKSRSPGRNVHQEAALPRKFQNDGMFDAYQPWVIKTYGDLAKTKTITIKKYARILRTLRGEEVNSAENSKFRFWVKSKGFHIGQPDGYDAKPADKIVGRHAVTGPGLDPPLYVPTQLPHNKALNGAEGTVTPGRVYKKVAIVENFFDIIHAVHVDLEGRPGKHAGQKRTYRTITETYAFLPREAVTRFLLGCMECQRRPRTPSPSSLSNQSQSTATSLSMSASTTTTTTPPSPSGRITSPVQSSPKYRDGCEGGRGLYGYRHHRQHRSSSTAATTTTTATSSSEKPEREHRESKEEKYNPLSITNLLKKESVMMSSGYQSTAGETTSSESRRTPESDRASSRGSVSSKRKRMLPEGRRSTPSPQPGQPLTRPWSPGLDPKSTAIDYSLPITTSYLKHQQRLLMAEKRKRKKREEEEGCLADGEEGEVEGERLTGTTETSTTSSSMSTATTMSSTTTSEIERKLTPDMVECAERERFSPAAGLIDTNLNLLATIQHLHCQVMLALNERLKPTVVAGLLPPPLVLPVIPNATNGLPNGMSIGTEVLPMQTEENGSSS